MFESRDLNFASISILKEKANCKWYFDRSKSGPSFDKKSNCSWLYFTVEIWEVNLNKFTTLVCYLHSSHSANRRNICWINYFKFQMLPFKSPLRLPKLEDQMKGKCFECAWNWEAACASAVERERERERERATATKEPLQWECKSNKSYQNSQRHPHERRRRRKQSRQKFKVETF